MFHGENFIVDRLLDTLDFTGFYSSLILAGDYCVIKAEEIVNDLTVYGGDSVKAMVDDPGALTLANLNLGKWNIVRKLPIGLGTRITGIHGGRLFEETLDDDFRYICVSTGLPETMQGAGNGTAIWKKSAILQSTI